VRADRRARAPERRAQIGGVLEPVNASPVVIEDEVLVGGNCGVYEGTIVARKAVLAAGVVLTRGTPVYDLVHERVLSRDARRPLEIPAARVVVPGARTSQAAGARAGTLAADADHREIPRRTTDLARRSRDGYADAARFRSLVSFAFRATSRSRIAR
jgi:hypothetical protein